MAVHSQLDSVMELGSESCALPAHVPSLRERTYTRAKVVQIQVAGHERFVHLTGPAAYSRNMCETPKEAGSSSHTASWQRKLHDERLVNSGPGLNMDDPRMELPSSYPFWYCAIGADVSQPAAWLMWTVASGHQACRATVMIAPKGYE
ncbi:hypothetical protein OPT61_g4794 [Boeremia exigua]|uniref:Uncharacterized protein n=1 Tax=Boeremia exigua TaxID=749465 RepID=A0ACC2ICS7_9PLEO|nr:hypothetical protein OPT61_g4794 [Boeremia exigua]